MSVKVLAIGDLCLKKEYDHVLAEKELLNTMISHDIVTCDLGIPLCSSIQESPVKVGPYESQLDSSVVRCKEIGINLARLAGNHIMDYGIQGAQELIDALGALNIDSMGVSSDYREAYKPVIRCIDNLKLAFFSAGQMEFGCAYEEGISGFAWINSHELDRQIKEIRNEVDYIFIFPHAGVESTPVPMPEWRNRYYSLIDLGADFILATHPHIIQGIEEYEKGIIAYSLGNFAYDDENPDDWEDWNRSIGISFELSADGYSYKVIPFQYDSGTVRIADDNIFNKKFQFANELLINEELYKSELDKISEELWYKYYSGYYAINAVKSGGIINSAFLFHNIGIESHDYICRRALRNRMYSEKQYDNNALKCNYLLWGAGKLGHAAMKFCEEMKVNIIGVADSNEKLSGKLVEGYKIFNVEEAIQILRERSDVVVMACVGTRGICEIKCTLFEKIGSRECISYEDFRIRVFGQELFEELQNL